MTNLLPCPMCGGKAYIERSSERFEYSTGGPNSIVDYGYYVFCTDCDISLGTVNVPPSSEEEATRLWNRRTVAIPPDVRERLADYAHEAWSGWMKHMFTIGTLLNDKWMSPEPGQQAKLLLPEWAVERWRRQMNTPYAELPESEKASDRKEADEILTIIRKWLDQQDGTP